MSQPDLDWMLDDILTVDHVRHAVVLSADGLPIGRSAKMPREDAERLAAACAGMQSLARGIAGQVGDGGETGEAGGRPEQIMIEFGDGFLFLVAAGSGAHLAVAAGASVDAGLVAHQMQVLVARIGEHLSSPPRGEDGAR